MHNSSVFCILPIINQLQETHRLFTHAFSVICLFWTTCIKRHKRRERAVHHTNVHYSEKAGSLGTSINKKKLANMPARLRRRRDSNPRNVAVQQFSRLPPSTTRPHLRMMLEEDSSLRSEWQFLQRDAKIIIKICPPKIISSPLHPPLFRAFHHGQRSGTGRR